MRTRRYTREAATPPPFAFKPRKYFHFLAPLFTRWYAKDNDSFPFLHPNKNPGWMQSYSPEGKRKTRTEFNRPT